MPILGERETRSCIRNWWTGRLWEGLGIWDTPTMASFAQVVLVVGVLLLSSLQPSALTCAGTRKAFCSCSPSRIQFPRAFAAVEQSCPGCKVRLPWRKPWKPRTMTTKSSLRHHLVCTLLLSISKWSSSMMITLILLLIKNPCSHF